MTTNKEKIIELLSIRSISEIALSKKSGIPLKELRPLLGILSDEKVIDHMGKMIWIKGFKQPPGLH